MSRGANRTSATTLAWHIDHRGANRRKGLRARIQTLLAVIATRPADDLPTGVMLKELEAALEPVDVSHIWLALTVLGARLPNAATVKRTERAARLDGALTALTRVLRAPHLDLRRAAERWPSVEIITDQVIVDMHHTSQTDFATGIQRVARQSAVRWHRDHAPVYTGWNSDYSALRRLSAGEVERALHGGKGALSDRHPMSDVVVPWRCTYVLPELLAEPPRAQRLRAMVEFSQSSTGVIGFDCVPLTSAETTAYGMSGGFALNLAAVAHMDRVATISQGAAVEYGGWRAMLQGAGLQGPLITAISLPDEGNTATEAALTEARRLLTTREQPMVLVVGSHEPRKNHLAVLHAAELLWREGLNFSLNFVGGNSWNSERFARRLRELQAAERPVQSISALSDDLLWAAYRIARCTVFPSLNEGFGLPVAESLASGTPAITSGFGSMREIAAEGGALLIDPRDDHSIADAMRRLLTDDELHAKLSDEAQRRPRRTWDEYAEETWQFLVNGARPGRTAEKTMAAAGGE